MNKLILSLLALLFILGCKTTETITLPEQVIEIENPFKTERPVYQASYTKKFDLIHTKLAVSFNWENLTFMVKKTLHLNLIFIPPSNWNLMHAEWIFIK